MFWDDIKLVTEQIQNFGLREPFVDLGGLAQPVIADYDLTIKTGDQFARYVKLLQRPFDHIDSDYLILNPEQGDPLIEELPLKYSNAFGTAVCLNVIEHVENPFQVFNALYKIMKPNSLLVISTVFSFPYHPTPRDYWRYTPKCLRHLGESAGFTVIESDWRLYVPASKGILDINKNECQEIRSVFITLTKENFQVLPATSYKLPKRISENPRANQFINLEQTVNEVFQYLDNYQRNLNNQFSLANLGEARDKVAKNLLELPYDWLGRAYLYDLGKAHQMLLSSGIKDEPLTEIEQTFLNNILECQRQFNLVSEWEYLPTGWATKDTRIKGWNEQSILAIREANLPYFTGLVSNTEPVGKNYGTHNTYMAYAYVLALAARKKDCISMLDWGGGIGDYYLISKTLLPDVEINYHCKEVPLLCQGGEKLLPEVNFHTNEEECFKQNYDLVLASSSLQYCEDWQQVSVKLAAVSNSYLYITRLPIVHQVESFVVVQRPYQYGYQTEYMGWFLNRQEFLDFVSSLQMELVREFLIQERPLVHGAPEQGECRGFLFRSLKAGAKA